MYTKKLLIRTNIHDLRRIGKTMGVKAPTTLKKAKLIQSILDIQEGLLEPVFSNLGRKNLASGLANKGILDAFNFLESLEESEEFFEKALDDFLAELKNKILFLYKNTIEKTKK